ncbi:hypothetical protein KC19_10G166000 [Ceratodon purpureus]|uniref:Uncharacterized protein n=1 Tax=Ceratodon purpureus TaxID=3225 RepID=A0A8T0GRE1_CERPU|nr:hypothetical protein KC19_10G166000 [Ceratodon purpureus]
MLMSARILAVLHWFMATGTTARLSVTSVPMSTALVLS